MSKDTPNCTDAAWPRMAGTIVQSVGRSAAFPDMHAQPARVPRGHRLTAVQTDSAGSAVAEFLGPVPELGFEGEVVAAGHGLEQLGAHGRFGGEAGRAARDGEGVADTGSGVGLEQCVGVERGGVDPFRSSPPALPVQQP